MVLTKKKKKPIKVFDFSESLEAWKDFISEQRFKSFTHSSSFVGNVRYDQDLQEMTALLGGERYTWCNVPQRVFDGWEGANSKGAYFAREIKGLFDC